MTTYKEPTFVRLPKNKLKVNTDFYQKEYVPANVQKLAKVWDDKAVGTLTVTHDGNDDYWVVDGQHRLLAAMKLPHVRTLPCMVHDSDDVNTDARLYIKINTTHKKPDARHLFRVSYDLGEEPAHSIGNMLNDYGFLWRTANSQTSTKPVVSCINTLLRVHSDYGNDILDESLRLLSIVHDNDTTKARLDSDVLRGTGYILKHYTIPDYSIFEDSFSQCSPTLLKATVLDAKRNYPFRSGSNGTPYSVSAKGVANAVNSKLVGRSKSKYKIFEEAD